jgi:tRNA dimethylallyltransferase
VSVRSRAVLLVGPTAVGKSEVALLVAERLGGEIVSLDSRQMVTGLDIGTAKPTAADRARVPHHLVDIAAPDEALPLSTVLQRAYAVVDDIVARGRRPILVGGTGQYVRALREGWTVPDVPPDLALRTELGAYAAERGPEALHARLARIDPLAAAAIDPRNVRRVIRALEIHARTGLPPTVAQRREGARYDLLVIGLIRPRPVLYARVDARIDAMVAAGLEEEARGLVAAGYDWHLPALSSVGYGEWRGYFAGHVDRAEAIRLIRHNTRRLVRNQGAWFPGADPGIVWVDLEGPGAVEAVIERAGAWLAGSAATAEVTASTADARSNRGSEVGTAGPAIIQGNDPARP